MPEKRFKDIQKILESLLTKYGIEQQVYHEQLITNWEKIVGKTLSNECQPIQIENKILFLKVKNSVWRNELSLRQIELIDLISGNFRKNIITRINFL